MSPQRAILLTRLRWWLAVSAAAFGLSWLARLELLRAVIRLRAFRHEIWPGRWLSPFRALPTQLEYWLIVAAMVSVLAGLVLLLLPIKRVPLHDARWATWRDLTRTRRANGRVPRGSRGLALPTHRARRDGISLAWYGDAPGRLLGVQPGTLAREELMHVALIGKTGDGKGLILTQNAVYNTASSVIVDPKGGVFRQTAAFRREVLGHEIVVISPDGLGHGYDALADIGDDDESLRAAASLIVPAEGEGRDFDERAQELLLLGMRATLLAGQPVFPGLEALTGLGLPGYGRAIIVLAERGQSEAHRRLCRAVIKQFSSDPRAMSDATIQNDRYLMSAWGTLDKSLTVFLEPAVIRALSNPSAFRAAMLHERPITVYVTFPEEKTRALAPVLRLVLFALETGLKRRAAGASRGQLRRVVMYYDECGTIAPPNLPESLAYLREFGVTIVYVLQSTAQLKANYGEGRAAAALGNTPAQLYFTPGDLETARYLTQAIGETTREWRERQGDHFVLRNERGPLLTPDDAMTAPFDRCFLVVSNFLRVQCRRLEHFNDDRLVATAIRMGGIALPTLPAVPEVHFALDGGAVTAPIAEANRPSGRASRDMLRDLDPESNGDGAR